ncbi:transmembrane emp24 domain-containing protein 5 [Ctenocephalides felis]|uniref:transmembrane emp24 domain-containing protein 5 n=1 Tax=Ctenocephalides felis TaxID=7515 RepID=UPI000E6E1BFE|nr:transmembrane emp24 domain-containing protein 5 [Ctenocephalides felis]
MSVKNILYIISLCLCINHGFGMEKDMTVNIDPGKQDCFYQWVKAGQVIDFEYQVIDGSHGDLDISFQLMDPNGQIIFADFKKSDNVHRLEAKMDGDYRFCFDNTFSSFNSKTVFFELLLENEGDDDDKWDDNVELEGLTPEEFYDMKIQDIHDSIARVRSHISKVRHLQELFRTYEARDRNVAEENNFKVNSWSMFQIFAMICVGVLQVVMVRSLFDTESKVNKIWTKVDKKFSN